MTGYSPKHCRVLASVSDGDNAFVLIDTIPPARRYLYGVNCSRSGDEWFEGGGGNVGEWSSGWSPTGNDLGTWTLCGECPAEAERIRVDMDGHTSEHPVRDSVYLAVFFKKPSTAAPRVTEMRINGEWLAVPDWQEFFSGFR